ncbi:hypothetical protein [Ktedonobacter robiniae]|uniref:Uncharacterized protein n=1 Tax=Ktedonobacter robiniae TaxID=2778365 RepID=A0ABQ3US29_9CHLR|nr:hypothetical protein [Ktedonobacter robiniae]GHO55609.1 hypothetical protein KSB_40840 [Ktedonobacter robiniae]
MSQDPQEDKLFEFLSSIPRAKVMKSGGGRIFLRGFQKSTDCNYSLSLRVDEDHSLAFSEEYNYLPREDDDGMVYVYALVIPSEQQEAFLKLLVQKCGHAEVPQESARPELILNLLSELVKQKQLTIPESGQRNVNLISTWLKAASIPHPEPYVAF